MSGNTETLSICVRTELATELRAAAKRTGIPMSRLVAQGLRLRLAELTPAAKRCPVCARELSAQEVERGYCAAGHAGSSDIVPLTGERVRQAYGLEVAEVDAYTGDTRANLSPGARKRAKEVR